MVTVNVLFPINTEAFTYLVPETQYVPNLRGGMEEKDGRKACRKHFTDV
jgi:hypothetical protein